MPGDFEDNDPLLRAIAELRADMHQLIDEQVKSIKERIEDLAPPRALRAAPVLNGTEPPDETSKVRSLDPRQRLDALARHLDHKLRLANVPAPDRAERGPSSEE